MLNRCQQKHLALTFCENKCAFLENTGLFFLNICIKETNVGFLYVVNPITIKCQIERLVLMFRDLHPQCLPQVPAGLLTCIKFSTKTSFLPMKSSAKHKVLGLSSQFWSLLGINCQTELSIMFPVLQRKFLPQPSVALHPPSYRRNVCSF